MQIYTHTQTDRQTDTHIHSLSLSLLYFHLARHVQKRPIQMRKRDLCMCRKETYTQAQKRPIHVPNRDLQQRAKETYVPKRDLKRDLEVGISLQGRHGARSGGGLDEVEVEVLVHYLLLESLLHLLICPLCVCVCVCLCVCALAYTIAY